MDRQAAISNRLESPITANLDNLQAKKNFSVSHLLDLEEAGEMVGNQADEGVGEAGRSMLESPGLTSGSDTTQQESKCAQMESDCQPQTKLICFHHAPAEPRARARAMHHPDGLPAAPPLLLSRALKSARRAGGPGEGGRLRAINLRR